MTWSTVVVVCSVLIAMTEGINRPVYKVVLSQKGYTQFLQYDVETPPLREFTFCTWIRIYDLGGDQSIFTYVANGNNRVVRLWLDSGGRYMKVSINGKLTSSTLVDIVKDDWRHVCLSYQSDYGAWALYLDAKLVSCEVTQNLQGFVLPRGGSIIIGYGTADNGKPNGLDGEIFGTNMILSSTIERNHMTKSNHLYDQKTFRKNKVKADDKNINYIILSDLDTDEIHHNFEKIVLRNKSKSFIKIKTPHINLEHDVGIDVEPKTENAPTTSKEKEIIDFSISSPIPVTSEKSKMNIWHLINHAGQEGKFKVQKKAIPALESSGTMNSDLSVIPEYETPPPPDSKNIFYKDNLSKAVLPMSIIDTENKFIHGFNTLSRERKNSANILPDVETPPPPEKDTKVYGQWTSSKFAGSVLNYLKSINFQNREKKTPATIPLTKFSDYYPYASDFKITKLRPPVQFQRRSFKDHRIKLRKRGISDEPERNVQIIEDDLRSTILKEHAETHPINVEVTNRGQITKQNNSRFYRNINPISIESSESMENIYKPRPFEIKANAKKTSKVLTDYEVYRNHNLMTILPFLKSLEYFVEDSKNTRPQNVLSGSKTIHPEKFSKMYSKSLSNANKWHNVKSFNNDYTPRRIKMDSTEEKGELDETIAEMNKKHPSIRYKYKHESNKLVINNEEPRIIKGRELAMSVSNQSDTNRDSVSIIKYNHGFLPAHDKKVKTSEKVQSAIKVNQNTKRMNMKNNFNKNVKLGNALNEQHVIGYDEQQKMNSFLGGDENIPDIHRYRSDLDNENINVPSSLGPRVCGNMALNNRVLYVQPDDSIDASHIMSPVKRKNIGIEFIHQNYKRCSLEGSSFENSYLLFIDWNKTPVRLFGGAYPKKTTDLCGFFK